MTRAKRIVLTVMLLVLSANVLEASLWRRRAPKPADAPPAATMSLAAIDADAERVVLRTSGAPAYTSYSPAPDVFVVDLTATSRPADLAIPSSLPASVASITAEEAVEMGATLTRVTFRLSHPVPVQATADGAAIVVAPQDASAPLEVATVAPSAVEVEAPQVEALPEPAEARVEEAVPVSEPLVPSSPARVVRGVETTGTADDLVVRIAGDGAFKYNAFKLESPSRLVIDLEGVTNAAASKTVEVNQGAVKRVRLAQFKSAPAPVTRVVVDLGGSAVYRVYNDGNAVAVAFGGSTAPVQTAELPAAPVTPAVREAAPAPAPVPVREEIRTAAVKQPAADVAPPVPVIAENASNWKMPAQASAGAKAVIRAPAPQTPPATQPRNEDIFSEALNTPAETQQQSQAKSLSASGKIFTGEPLDLSLKDADIKDVLRTFAQLTGLNIAVDPGVQGTVTVDFVDVPWDQALDLILRQNGLMYTLEGNVMRVGSIARLTAETEAAIKLQEKEQLNVPLSTVSFKLSYSKAEDVEKILKGVASERAKIITDVRTNQLIISEVPQYLQTMRNLIDTVDVPNPQVVIEARIVETTKQFSRAWGFSWGFDGVFDPALGNGTGLVFPNRIGYSGGTFDFTAGAGQVLGLSFTDVLGTFNLDFALHAAELEQLVKVVSAPRLTTQDNNSAEIQSGVQIPYQTRINFTTTVTYTDATLKLTVLPQITQSGTVIMDIEVNKTTPGEALEGATGLPLNKRSAKTRLMVRDGGTAIIGGIYQSSDNNASDRIPVLHTIPVLGNLFKSNRMTSTHDELLIFITPRIVRG